MLGRAPRRQLGLSFVPCPGDSRLLLRDSLPVPLDRAGPAPGTISLSVERKLAGAAPSRDAVVALAGGPGQAALPLGQFIAQAIAPALGSRDLLVFDQRGTGASDPLSCGASKRSAAKSVSELFEQCALEIGPGARRFTTAGIGRKTSRRCGEAAGYEKLVLYGTSYGTKVALEYAERYPQHVEALVLDSVVPAEGPEPFAIPTFQAIAGRAGRALRARRVRRHHLQPGRRHRPARRAAAQRPLSGSGLRRGGQAPRGELTRSGLLDILEAGDLNPALRALLPAAVRSALRHDPDPLLRLHLLSEGLIPSVPIESPTGEDTQEIDEALFTTTTCEETPFPWQRGATAATRLSEALGFLHAQPAARLLPVRRDAPPTTTASSSECAAWPDASPAPPAASAAAGRAHADPLRRAGPAHAHRQRARRGRRRSPTRSWWSSRSPGTRCSAATSAAAPRGGEGRSSRAAPVQPCRRTRPTSSRPRR